MEISRVLILKGG